MELSLSRPLPKGLNYSIDHLATSDLAHYPFTCAKNCVDLLELTEIEKLFKKGNFSPISSFESIKIVRGKPGFLSSNQNDTHLEKVFDSEWDQLVIFTKLLPDTSTPTRATYKAVSSLTLKSTKLLFSKFNVNPRFLPNFLGRANYWAPESYSSCLDTEPQASTFFEFFVQHPRWWSFSAFGKEPGVRAPLSVYMRTDVITSRTIYIIVSKSHATGLGSRASPADTCVESLKAILKLANQMNSSESQKHSPIHLQTPFDVHVLLLKLSCEASKELIMSYQTSLFQSLDESDRLVGIEGISDASRGFKLKKSIIDLQDLARDANKMISDVEVTITDIADLQEAYEKFPIKPNTNYIQEALHYTLESQKKQLMWLKNYKSRNDIAQALVFNLTMQSDAETNIAIGKAMQEDSKTLKAILVLTMVFLPPTFASTLVSAQVFNDGMQVTLAKHIVVFWVVLTAVLTCATFAAWWAYPRAGGWKMFTGKSDDKNSERLMDGGEIV